MPDKKSSIKKRNQEKINQEKKEKQEKGSKDVASPRLQSRKTVKKHGKTYVRLGSGKLAPFVARTTAQG
ncbi:MAG: hypothetical protein Q7R99_03295 [bacterium]|nr:hypothetical protein [bacterium]